jgi:uncharacterized membrane protein
MPRLLSLDLARGFTVAFIPTIHCVILYSTPTVHQSLLGTVLAFIAEWPGAQLLLFIMGVSFCFSRISTMGHLKKAFILMLAGYFLNALKFLVPLWLDVLPDTFLTELEFEHEGFIGFYLLMVGDILHCAGIALAIMALLQRLPYVQVYALFLAYIVILCAPLFWDMHHENLLADHLLHLVGGKPDHVFFPLFPWLAYPLVGMAVGQYLKSQFYSKLALSVTGAFLLASGYVMHIADAHFPETSFWRTYPDSTIMHLGFVLLWVSLWMWIEGPAAQLKKISMDGHNDLHWGFLGRIIHFLCYCSEHITLIYLMQWVVIFLLLGIVGYHELDMAMTIVVVGVVNLAVFGAMKIWSQEPNIK